ncbi:MAG: LPXTG cell wall anchor domain-containing protein [Coriobacteriia bacterium]|nr:LPXTG cell wall anchor domain-containing protein [Coriobacteriia bacterium]
MKTQGKKVLQRSVLVSMAAALIMAGFATQPASLQAEPTTPTPQVLPAPTIGSPDVTVSTEASLTAVVAAAPTGTQYVIAISGTIKLTQTLIINAGKNIILTGGGTLSGAGDFDDITVSGRYNSVPGAILTLADITITHDAGKTGRGIYVDVSSGDRTVATLNIVDGALITGNNYVYTDNDNRYYIGSFYSGGGVFCYGILNMWGGVISHNSVSTNISTLDDLCNGLGCGGGVAVAYVSAYGPFPPSTTFNMYGGTISDNSASNKGGGVFLAEGVPDNVMVMSGGTITGNTAGVNGGGVAVGYSTSWVMTTGSDMYNTLLVSGGSITNNSAAACGGGIYSKGASIVTVTGDALISKNKAACGGGIYSEGNTGMSPNVFDAGVVPYVEVGYSTTTNIEGGSITGNTATVAGGGVYNSGLGADYIVASDSVYNCGIELGGSLNGYGYTSITDGYYDAYFLGDYPSVTTVTGGTISGNSAPTGGGFYNTGVLNVSGGAVSNNKATSGGNGGGIYNDASAFEFPPVLKALLANAQYMTYDHVAEVAQSRGDDPPSYPTLVPLDYVAHGSLTISGAATVSDNTAQNGGGVYNSQDATTTVKAEATLTDNSAKADGGGIYTKDYAQLFVEQGATFTDNSAALAAMRKPADDALYAQQIQASSWTMPFTQGYNNYDINYQGFKLTILADTGGAAVSATDPAIATGKVQLKATPASGYTFTGWSVESLGAVTLSSATDPDATFIMPFADVTITAHFAPQSSEPAKPSAPVNPSKPAEPKQTPKKSTPQASKKSTPAAQTSTSAVAHTASSSLPETGDVLSTIGLLVAVAFALSLSAFLRRRRRA